MVLRKLKLTSIFCYFSFILPRKRGTKMGSCTLYRYLVLFLLLLKLCSEFTVASSIVKFLPGFDGPLPFELETRAILNFEQERYHGSVPNLLLNPRSWTKVASIIFLDLPVGTGFSHARTSEATHSTDLQTCDRVYEFLRKWLLDHPAFISNPVYVSGDSNSGITVPIVTTLISNG